MLEDSKTIAKMTTEKIKLENGNIREEQREYRIEVLEGAFVAHHNHSKSACGCYRSTARTNILHPWKLLSIKI